MDTHLINSQMLSRKDVRVWFWDGGAEFIGYCKMIADRGHRVPAVRVGE